MSLYRYIKIGVMVGLFLAGQSLSCFARGNDKVNEISFDWAFFLKAKYGFARNLNFEGPEHVSGGDLLRIYLQLHDSCHVYLFLYDSRQDFYLVFPPNTHYYDAEFPAWEASFIPSEREWFNLDDHKGTETFYLLATPERQEELEGLVDEYLTDKDNDELKGQLIDLISQKINNSAMTSGVTETPLARPLILKDNQIRPNSVGDALQTIRVDAGGAYGRILELKNQ
ncbi:MAG: DUF4384 domain-containing protein [Proteobacteria bacterium]|nr:DUF4384 domain-containing protein [Pseudomonadota bacterium]MBU1688247.1 DUF4384 domain-containing protein [Pseudomonadota bacterium]